MKIKLKFYLYVVTSLNLLPRVLSQGNGCTWETSIQTLQGDCLANQSYCQGFFNPDAACYPEVIFRITERLSLGTLLLHRT
jgi:hypothetical protein